MPFRTKTQLQADDDFIRACEQDDIDKVKKLLTCKNPLYKADINAKTDWGFRQACKLNNLSVVEYLLSSKELNKWADIHAIDDDGFISACANGCTKVLDFLIFEMNIKKTQDIQNFLESDKNRYASVADKFDQRDIIKQHQWLNQKLDNNIPEDEMTNFERSAGDDKEAIHKKPITGNTTVFKL